MSVCIAVEACAGSFFSVHTLPKVFPTMVDIDKHTLMKTKLRYLSIKTLHSSSRVSFCWKKFGLLMITVDGKKRFVPSDQVYCMVCLENAKKVYKDQLFESVKVKSYSKKISTGNLIRHLKEEHQLFEEEPRKRKSREPHKPREPRKPRKSRGKREPPELNERHEPDESYQAHESCEPQEPCDIEEFQNSIINCPSSSSKIVFEIKPSKWSLGRDLTLWFCRSLLSFDSVNDEATVELLKNYNVTVTAEDLPSQTGTRNSLDNIYTCMVECIKQSIATSTSRHIAVTADLWSDCYKRHSYITLSLHFISDSFVLENATLATQPIIGSKTIENISNCLMNILQRFALQEKHLFLVSNIGLEEKKVVKLLSEKITCKTHYCLGQAFHNLVVDDGIKNTPNLLKLTIKCNNIIKTLRLKLPEIEDTADEEQKIILSCIENACQIIEHDENLYFDNNNEMEIDHNGVTEATVDGVESKKKFLSTRWQSLLALFECLYNKYNRIPINQLLIKLEKSDLILNETEWLLIKQLTDFLSKFRDCVSIMSVQNTCTINMTLVFKMEVAEILESLEEKERIEIFHMKKNMKTNLDHRFPTNELSVAATLLDCRFQAIKEVDKYLQMHNLNRVSFLASYTRQILNTEDLHVNKINIPSPSTMENSSQKKSSSVLMQLALKYGGARDSTEVENNSIETECCKYFAGCDPLDLSSGDILNYWKERKAAYPCLSTLAKRVLCTPAISTNSERMFTVAGLTLAAKRSHLSGSNINKIIFVHDNYNKFENCIDNPLIAVSMDEPTF